MWTSIEDRNKEAASYAAFYSYLSLFPPGRRTGAPEPDRAADVSKTALTDEERQS